MNIESARECVRSIYRVLLGREPDAGGLEHFARHIEQTGDTHTVLMSIVESTEFTMQRRKSEVDIRHPLAQKIQSLSVIYKRRVGFDACEDDLLSLVGKSNNVGSLDMLCHSFKRKAGSQTRILLFGAYGNGNLGDAYQALALRAHLIANWQITSESIFACSLLNVADYPFPEAQKVSPNKIFNHEFLSSFDGILIGGGGLLAHPHEPLLDSNWISKLHVPVMLFAIGATTSVCNESSRLINDAFFVAGRDAESIDALSSIKDTASFAPDPILAIPKLEDLCSFDVPTLLVDQPVDVLWILKYPANDDDLRLIEEAKKLARHNVGGIHTFVCIEPALDQKLLIFFKAEELIFISSAADLLKLIGTAKVVLSMRYHGVIFSLLADKSVYGMSQYKSAAIFTEFGFDGAYIKNPVDLRGAIENAVPGNIGHRENQRRVSRTFRHATSNYKILNACVLRETENRQPEKRRVFDNGFTIGELTSIGSDKLAITFQPYGCLGFEAKGFGEDFLISLGYDVLCFKTTVNEWYQNVSLDDMRHQVNQCAKQYRFRVGYGSNMGAYAALYFAEVLDLHKVIAFSPQFSVDRKLVPFEPRWEKEASALSFTHAEMTSDCGVEVITIYDSFDRLDKIHATLIRQRFPAGQDITLPFTGHPSVWALRECDLLRHTVECLLHEHGINLHDIRKSIRERSKDYATNILQRCRNRGVKRTAQVFNMLAQDRASDRQWILKQGLELGREFCLQGRIDEACSIAATIARICGRDVGALRSTRDFLSSLQLWADAARVGTSICELPESSVIDLVELAHLLAKDGRLKASLGWISRAIALEGNVAEFHRLRASVLERMGMFREAEQAIGVVIELLPDGPELQDDRLRIATRLIEQLRHERDATPELSRAIIAAEEIAHRCPNSVIDISSLAHLLAKAERLEASLGWISRAIAFDGSVAESYRLRASLLERMGRFREAYKAVKFALQLSPDHPEMLEDLRRIRKGFFLRSFGLWHLRRHFHPLAL